MLRATIEDAVFYRAFVGVHPDDSQPQGVTLGPYPIHPVTDSTTCRAVRSRWMVRDSFAVKKSMNPIFEPL